MNHEGQIYNIEFKCLATCLCIINPLNGVSATSRWCAINVLKSVSIRADTIRGQCLDILSIYPGCSRWARGCKFDKAVLIW